MPTKPRVLLVEDESDIRSLMQLHLTREGYEVLGTEDGEEALKLVERSGFELAILDWMLPGISGLELCKRFAGKFPILMVTARADAADIVLGLELGADDYVVKPFEIPVFLARVRALLRRARADSTVSASPSSLHAVGNLRLDSAAHKVWCGQDEVKLTLSEFKLLHSLLENQGRVLSRAKLVALIQGQDISVTVRTVDTHVFGLRKKLGPCADVIETIRGVGYRVTSE